jgi:hypothetical protein
MSAGQGVFSLDVGGFGWCICRVAVGKGLEGGKGEVGETLWDAISCQVAKRRGGLQRGACEASSRSVRDSSCFICGRLILEAFSPL